MKDPCHDCLVQTCCENYCDKKAAYNSKVKKMYLEGKNKYFFEQAIDDLMNLVKRKYGTSYIIREEVKRRILENP